MNYIDWQPIFNRLKNDLDLNFDEDITVANILEKNLKNKKILNIEQLKNKISNKKIYVFGAGPSLEKNILEFKDDFFNKTKIAADGATTALLEKEIIPDIIVTDLDGIVEDQILANSKGSIVLIHAHGDNIENIEKYVNKFEGFVLGSTQINPINYKNIINFGGFTDGDRAVYLADHFKAKKINLIGFDFNNSIGNYSFSKDKDIKFKKLKWCKLLIEKLNNDKIVYF